MILKNCYSNMIIEKYFIYNKNKLFIKKNKN